MDEPARTIPIRPHDGHGDREPGPASPQRRALVKWLAAAAALAAGGCSRRPPDGRLYSGAVAPPVEAGPDVPRAIATACERGGWAQGVRVTTRRGRPVKVEGNPNHPASLGGTDAQTQAEILQLWDPDRSTGVWHREADGNGARFAPSTWTAFATAWRERAGAGEALHVLTPRLSSPTLMHQLGELLQRRAGSRWYRHDSIEDAARAEGTRLAFGRRVQAVEHFDRADLVVAFGVDPFTQPGWGVRRAADWAHRRAASLAAGRPPPRALAVESRTSLFGARADERLALAPPAVETVLWRCAALLDAPGDGQAALAPPLEAGARRITALMSRHRGRTIVCGGAGLGARAHALVHWLNQQIGAYDDCIDTIAAPDHDDALPEPGTLAELGERIDAGAVRRLLILGANPVYTAADAGRLAARLARVPFSAHLSTLRDETSACCTWHLPRSHAFEQWSDARAFDGSFSIVQPAIAPLHDSRSAHELLALLTDAPASGFEIVRARWAARATPGDFEALWTDTLERGVAAGSASAPVRLPVVRTPTPPPPGPDRADTRAVWADFSAEGPIGDGDYANNAWLQEIPHPFTKIVWGNAVLLAPATARALGLAGGDVVRLRRLDGRPPGTDRWVEGPVWIEPGQAQDCATLALGYGRRSAGRVGTGVGFDVAALRSDDGTPVRLAIERTGAAHAFARTQIEMSQHGRDLARWITTAAALMPLPSTASPPPAPTLYPPLPADLAGSGPAWGMTVDLDACIGCSTCTVACQAENNIPVVGPEEVSLGRVMHWIRVDTDCDDGRYLSQPVPCMQCENAPCELVCPVGATLHDTEGINVQVYNRCVGTRFCSNNCPYKVRRFNFRQYADVQSETARLMRNPEVSVRSRGVMEKCNYCLHRLAAARHEEQRSGSPLPTDAVQTACQAACPTGAIHFGDLRDTRSEVVAVRRSPRHYTMLEELNTRPRTTYLARVVGPLKEGDP